MRTRYLYWLEYATCVDTSYIASKRGSIAYMSQVV